MVMVGYDSPAKISAGIISFKPVMRLVFNPLNCRQKVIRSPLWQHTILLFKFPP